MFLRRLAAEGGEVQRKAAGNRKGEDEKGTKSDKEVDVKRRNEMIPCFWDDRSYEITKLSFILSG